MCVHETHPHKNLNDFHLVASFRLFIYLRFCGGGDVVVHFSNGQNVRNG